MNKEIELQAQLTALTIAVLALIEHSPSRADVIEHIRSTTERGGEAVSASELPLELQERMRSRVEHHVLTLLGGLETR